MQAERGSYYFSVEAKAFKARGHQSHEAPSHDDCIITYYNFHIFFSYNKTDVAAPFGGFKRSGFGKDLGREALNEYLKTKTITFEYNL